jgi:two-component system sensor histidine kinase UhpB
VRWDGIMTNITESKLEQLEVRQSRARLAELSAHTERVKEQERTRIAREIHDELGGNLTAIKMALAMLAARLGRPAPIRRCAKRPTMSTPWSTAPSTPSTAFRWTCARRCWTWAWWPRWNGRSRNSASRPGSSRLQRQPARDRPRQRPGHRAVPHRPGGADQYRQARARQPGDGQAGAPAPSRQPENQRQRRGIRPADRAKPASFGLRGMAERARALGGTLTLSHATGGGTVVSIKIKLDTAREALIAAAGATIAKENISAMK